MLAVIYLVSLHGAAPVDDQGDIERPSRLHLRYGSGDLCKDVQVARPLAGNELVT